MPDDPLLKYLLQTKLDEAEFSGEEITEALPEVTLIMAREAAKQMHETEAIKAECLLPPNTPRLDIAKLLAREIDKYRETQRDRSRAEARRQQRERARKPRRPRAHTRKLKAQIKRLWRAYEAKERPEQDRARLIYKEIRGQVSIVRIREIIRESGLRKRPKKTKP